MSISPYENAGNGFGDLVRLTPEHVQFMTVHARKTPYGADIVATDDLGGRTVARLLRTEIAALVAMLPELGIDMLTHAVWVDEFGQWWNVYRRASFATEAGAETDLRIRLAEALS